MTSKYVLVSVVLQHVPRSRQPLEDAGCVFHRELLYPSALVPVALSGSWAASQSLCSMRANTNMSAHPFIDVPWWLYGEMLDPNCMHSAVNTYYICTLYGRLQYLTRRYKCVHSGGGTGVTLLLQVQSTPPSDSHVPGDGAVTKYSLTKLHVGLPGSYVDVWLLSECLLTWPAQG